MQPALEEEEESSVGMSLQLLIEDLLAEVVVAVRRVPDEEGQHQVVAEENDSGQKLPQALLALVDATDLTDARVLGLML